MIRGVVLRERERERELGKEMCGQKEGRGEELVFGRDTDRRAVLSFSTVNRSLCEICSLGNLLVCVKLNSLYFLIGGWRGGGS